MAMARAHERFETSHQEAETAPIAERPSLSASSDAEQNSCLKGWHVGASVARASATTANIASTTLFTLTPRTTHT